MVVWTLSRAGVTVHESAPEASRNATGVHLDNRMTGADRQSTVLAWQGLRLRERAVPLAHRRDGAAGPRCSGVLLVGPPPCRARPITVPAVAHVAADRMEAKPHD